MFRRKIVLSFDIYYITSQVEPILIDSMGRKIVLALALLFWMVAAALYLTAMLTDSWSRIEIPAISLLDTSDVSVQTNGLFKTCVNVFFGITCTNQGKMKYS